MPTGRGLDEWTEILSATHLGFDVQPTHRTPSKFDGAVSRRRFGGLALVDCASLPWLGRHGKSAGGDAKEPIMGFQLVRKGVELVRESGREVTLTAGDIVLRHRDVLDRMPGASLITLPKGEEGEAEGSVPSEAST